MFSSSADDKYVFTVGHFISFCVCVCVCVGGGGVRGALPTSKSIMCMGPFTVSFLTSVCMCVRVSLWSSLCFNSIFYWRRCIDCMEFWLLLGSLDCHCKGNWEL